MGGRDHLDLVRDQAEAVAEIDQADHESRSRRGREHQPDRVCLPADRQGMDLARRPAGGDRRTHLEHVRPQHLRVVRVEVVGVVLHERRAALEARAHHLQDPEQRRRLPVALRSEPVTVGHEPLDGDPRKLLQPVQVLERVGERREASGLEQRPQASLDPRGRAQRLAPLASLGQRRGDVVGVLVFAEQPLHLRVLDRCDRVHELSDAVAVHRDPESKLGLDLVAFRDRHLPHVVPEACDGEALRLVPPAGGARPRGDAPDDRRIAPVPGDGLAPELHPGREVSELPVAVCRLVQVHEVHVDLGPREIAVVLRVQVEEGLAQQRQPADPHLRRRERVHPRDQADARFRCVRLEAQPADRLGARHHRGLDDPDRDRLGAVQRGGDLASVLVRPGERRRRRTSPGCR